MKEKEGYREQLERLAEIYPNKITLTIPETAKALGIDKRTVLNFIKTKKLSALNISNGKERKRYVIPLSSVAKISLATD